MKRVRALLLDGKLPKRLWAECVCHVTTLINMTPSSKTDGRTPGYVHITEQYRDKFDARARLCMYLGVPDHKKGYRLMDINTHAIVYSRDVVFKEDEFPPLTYLTSTREPTQPTSRQQPTATPASVPAPPAPATGLAPEPEAEPISPPVTTPLATSDPVMRTAPGTANKRVLPSLREAIDRTAIHYSFRTVTDSDPPHTSAPTRPRLTAEATDTRINSEEACDVTFNSGEDTHEQEQRKNLLYTLLAIWYVSEPTTYREAMKSSHANQWHIAAKSEYKSLMDNNTWVLVTPPKGRKILSSRWVFVVKYTGTGEIDRFKARLEFGIDYNEAVIRMDVLRLLLIIAALLDLEVHQMDVKTAFLNGYLEEEIYMTNRKSLGFLKLIKDRCGFRRTVDNLICCIAVHIDDLLIIAATPALVSELKSALKKRFSMSDLGEVKYLLGWSIQRDRKRTEGYLSTNTSTLRRSLTTSATTFKPPCSAPSLSVRVSVCPAPQNSYTV
ncbi:Transposon protein [Phytophthora megakarya]|uniref:Transposon protein n=1 Tax=Phytophthora megakarya TaxID=4795 RepID=A0A225UNG7_9STRA|nr:Transposon protein [Phytophthora megakarya]